MRLFDSKKGILNHEGNDVGVWYSALPAVAVEIRENGQRVQLSPIRQVAIVNFTNLANDAQVARTTVYEYFEILKNTLVLHELLAWRKTKKRKPLAPPKKQPYFTSDLIKLVVLRQGRKRNLKVSKLEMRDFFDEQGRTRNLAEAYF